MGEKEEDACSIDSEGRPKGSGVAEVMYCHTSEDDAETHADIPAGEEGGVGCAPLVVGSEIDKHSLHARPDVAIAETYYKGCTVVAYGIFQQGKKQKAENTNENAMADVFDDFPLPQCASADKAREYQPTAKYGKPCARASSHAQHFFAIEGKVVGKHSVGQSDASDNNAFAPSFQKKETVEGERVFVRDNFLDREMDGCVNGTSYTCRKEGKEKEDVVVVNIIVNDESNGGSDAGSEIVGEPVVAYAFCSS